MRILGIDPGSRYLGWGAIELLDGKTRYEAHGVVRTQSGRPLAERLLQIFVELDQVFRRLEPEAVAVEGVFSHKNARSALILGHARGVALLLAARASVEVFEYAPARVKRSVGAGGNDGKEAVARMVTTVLGLTRPLERADAYDALAVALCHAGQVRRPGGSGRAKGKSAALPQSFLSRLAPGFVAAPERGP